MLHEIGDARSQVYFPTTAIVSLVDLTADGTLVVPRGAIHRFQNTGKTVGAPQAFGWTADTGSSFYFVCLVVTVLATLACLNLLLKVGLRRENVFVTDLAGVVYEGRTELMDEDKAQFARATELRTLGQV
mgnify:CR=1 FL=1